MLLILSYADLLLLSFPFLLISFFVLTLPAHHANSFAPIKNALLFFESFNIYKPSQGSVDLVLV